MAHGDTGTIEPVLVEQVEGRLAIDLQLVLTYVDDGERAEGATVTAVATSADGTTTAPVTLTPASAPGAYVGVLDVPAAGDWGVRIEASAPDASLEVPPVQVVAAEPGTTTTTSTATVATAPDPVLPDDDDGAMWGGIAVVGALVAVGAAIGYRLSRRRRA